jgi:signal transduction histidine kinase
VRVGAADGGRHAILRRVFLLVIFGVVAPMAAFAWLGSVSLDALKSRLLEERGALAGSLAGRFDQVVRDALAALTTTSAGPRFDLEDDDGAPERGALHTLLVHSRYLDGVFLAGPSGEPLWQEPSRGSTTIDPAAVARALSSGRPEVTGVIPGQGGVALLVPVRNWQGRVTGLAGALARTGGLGWSGLLVTEPRGPGEAVEVLDAGGRVVASTVPGGVPRVADPSLRAAVAPGRRRTLVVSDGGSPEVLAVAPLTAAPWTLVIRQPEREVFSAVHVLERRLLLAGPPLLALALVFAWGAARSLTRPLQVLTESAERIAAGDLQVSIPRLGEDEVGRLGSSLESMRVALDESMSRARSANEELERRVADRTRELQALYRELQVREERRGQLLRKVISAQEEERKRIARELHDETCQTLAALSMDLEAAGEATTAEVMRARLADASALTRGTIDEVHRVIFALRPSVLDDLGLLPAIRWFATRQVEPEGIAVRYEFEDLPGRLPPEVETALFRAVQEALTNVARHAQAENVLVEVSREGEELVVEVEDDGRGFEPREVSGEAPSGRGLGLMGIRERLELLGGSAHFDSAPGEGTRVVLRVPWPVAEGR